MLVPCTRVILASMQQWHLSSQFQKCALIALSSVIYKYPMSRKVVLSSDGVETIVNAMDQYIVEPLIQEIIVERG